MQDIGRYKTKGVHSGGLEIVQVCCRARCFRALTQREPRLETSLSRYSPAPQLKLPVGTAGIVGSNKAWQSKVKARSGFSRHFSLTCSGKILWRRVHRNSSPGRPKWLMKQKHVRLFGTHEHNTTKTYWECYKTEYKWKNRTVFITKVFTEWKAR